VPATKIEAFVVDQIKRIGADPALCDETFRQVQAQVAAERRTLKAEAKRIEREHMTGSHELDRLTSSVTRATAAAADALMAKLAETQERVTTLNRSQRQIVERMEALAGQDVDPEAVGRVLAQFTDLWDVLLTPERERIVRLLIERVDYDGAACELSFTFSRLGIETLVANVTSASRTS
jgi:site-specific DNA recombinase